MLWFGLNTLIAFTSLLHSFVVYCSQLYFCMLHSLTVYFSTCVLAYYILLLLLLTVRLRCISNTVHILVFVKFPLLTISIFLVYVILSWWRCSNLCFESIPLVTRCSHSCFCDTFLWFCINVVAYYISLEYDWQQFHLFHKRKGNMIKVQRLQMKWVYLLITIQEFRSQIFKDESLLSRISFVIVSLKTHVFLRPSTSDVTWKQASLLTVNLLFVHQACALQFYCQLKISDSARQFYSQLPCSEYANQQYRVLMFVQAATEYSIKRS